MSLLKILKFSAINAISVPVILVASTHSGIAHNQFLTSATASVVGAPLVVVSKGSGDVRWILPGKRPLDPKVFGTPQAPLGFEPDVGVPINQRLTNVAGTAWTTTRGPTPFSDNFAAVTGHYYYKVIDITLDDTPLSRDKVAFTASFTSPDSVNTYKVTVNQVIPVGPSHTFFGGVGTNVTIHGMTGIGSKLVPTISNQVVFWGVGSFEVNGSLIASNRVVHLMTSCNSRDVDYKLLFDDGVDCGSTHTHVVLSNVEITPTGPEQSPLPSGFILPNGVEQPFIHLMFENIRITALKHR